MTPSLRSCSGTVRHRELRTTLSALAIAAAYAPPALAQANPGSAPAPEAAASAASSPAGDRDRQAPAGAEPQVVTVTATRRREPLRDVPLRVETLGAEQLERSGATSLSDYLGGSPGIDVKTDGGPGRGQVSIRGVTTGDQTIATVGTYIDEVAFGSSSAFVFGSTSALDMSLLDLDHLEVLRGPQGTLYGAGAMGGLLKYVTNEPDTSAFSGRISVGARAVHDGAMGHTESAVLNVPLREDVAGLRVAAFDDHDGGFIKAVGLAGGDNVNSGDTRGARLSLLLEPGARFKVRLTATGQKIHREGTNYVEYDPATGRPAVADLTRPLSVAEPYDVKLGLASADLEYDFGWARLNAIGSVQRFDSATRLDATPIFADPSLDQVGLDNGIGLRKRTAELRLTSPRGTIEWLAGLYYDRETGHVDQTLWGREVADETIATLITTGQPSRYQERAAYGDLTYNLSPQWSVTAGARVARNDQTYGSVSNGTPDFTTSTSDTSRTYLATLRYSLNKESSMYVRAASGYRPGGPNPTALDANGQVVPGAPVAFQPDSLWSYELGYKADLMDRRLSLEAAAYDILWSDIQQNVAVGATTLTTNAGKAEVKGLELAARLHVAPWKLEGSFAYTDPRLTQDTPSLGASGSRLPNTARLAATLGGTYEFAVGSHTASAGLDLRYVGERNAGFDQVGTSLPNFRLPAYTLVDARTGIGLGAWELSAYVRNLTDQRVLLGADTALTAFGGPLRATVAQPRTVGVELTYRF